MRPNLLIYLSAIIDGISGLLLLFLPQQAMGMLLGEAAAGTERTGQLAAAAILGVAGYNWFNRFAKTGGIYGRPLVFGNLLHKMTLSFLLVGDAVRGAIPPAGVGLVIVYGLLAMAFAYAMIARSPVE
jgi:hypothetical protein